MAQAKVRTADIVDGQVTLAKMADVATDRLIGRDTAGTGVPEALTVGGGVEFTGSGGIQRSALSGDVTAAAGSASVTVDQARGLRETGGPTTLTMASVADGEVLYRTGTTIDGRVTSVAATYTTAGAYSLPVPSWVTSIFVRLQGGGGGGAAGGRADPGTAAEGGAGGNSGYCAEWSFAAADLTGDLQIIVGVGGTGATARVTNGGATGTGGSAGGDTSITDNNGAGAVVAVAQGGAAASARTAASVSNLAPDAWISNQGGAGSTGAANGGAGVATSLTVSPGSGGGGGAITAGNTPSNGGRGGKGALAIDYDGATNGQAGGTAAGGAGTDASASAGYRGAGGPGGGAGGAGDGSGNGGRGGDGTRGTGGGGGGAGHSPGSSGRGGNGGPGWAIIIFS